MNIIEMINYKKLFDYYRKKSISENKFYMLNDNTIQKTILKGNKYIKKLCQEWDDFGSIPLDAGNYLKSIIDDDNYILFGHRTAIFSEENIYSNEILYDVLTNGLINNGSALTNGSNKEKVPPISKTANIINNLIDLQIILKSHRRDSFGYISTGTVLLKFPKEYIDEEGDLKVDPNLIYDYDETNSARIKPEFIIGVTTLNDEVTKGECKFYSKEEILENQKTR